MSLSDCYVIQSNQVIPDTVNTGAASGVAKYWCEGHESRRHSRRGRKAKVAETGTPKASRVGKWGYFSFKPTRGHEQHCKLPAKTILVLSKRDRTPILADFTHFKSDGK